VLAEVQPEDKEGDIRALEAEGNVVLETAENIALGVSL